MGPLGTQNGLFSMLPLSSEQILAIRERHGVYMAGTGRINIAGLTTGNIEKFIEALPTSPRPDAMTAGPRRCCQGLLARLGLRHP
jgi:hypothetical protein